MKSIDEWKVEQLIKEVDINELNWSRAGSFFGTAPIEIVSKAKSVLNRLLGFLIEILRKMKLSDSEIAEQIIAATQSLLGDKDKNGLSSVISSKVLRTDLGKNDLGEEI